MIHCCALSYVSSSICLAVHCVCRSYQVRTAVRTVVSCIIPGTLYHDMYLYLNQILLSTTIQNICEDNKTIFFCRYIFCAGPFFIVLFRNEPPVSVGRVWVPHWSRHRVHDQKERRLREDSTYGSNNTTPKPPASKAQPLPRHTRGDMGR